MKYKIKEMTKKDNTGGYRSDENIVRESVI